MSYPKEPGHYLLRCQKANLYKVVPVYWTINQSLHCNGDTGRDLRVRFYNEDRWGTRVPDEFAGCAFYADNGLVELAVPVTGTIGTAEFEDRLARVEREERTLQAFRWITSVVVAAEVPGEPPTVAWRNVDAPEQQ